MKPIVPSVWQGEEGIYFVTEANEDSVHYLYYSTDFVTKFKNSLQIWEEEVVASGVTMVPFNE
jgi:hypothetical protein